ncbi:MAG: regulator of sigma E protease [Spirosomataceae bacterium]|jgi:regulator of sigma E protease
MEGLIMTAQLLLGLTILVGLHEFGHFAAARIFGIRVNKFYIFFDFLFPLPNVLNFALWKTKKGDTEFGLGWFPMGGYVDIEGMIDETKDASQLATEPQPYEFRSKPAWQRLIVMLGGIIVNVVLGVLIYIGITSYYGESKTPISEINNQGIVAYDIAEKMGLKTGDKVVAVDGKEVRFFEDFVGEDLLLGENIDITVLRDGKQLNVPVPRELIDWLSVAKREAKGNYFLGLFDEFEVGMVPQEVEQGWFSKLVKGKNDSIPPAARAGLTAGDKIVGINGKPITYYHEYLTAAEENKGKNVLMAIQRDGKSDTLEVGIGADGKTGFFAQMLTVRQDTTVYFSFGESVVKGTKDAFNVITANIKAFGKIFRGDVAFSNAVSGPVGIAKMFGGYWDWSRFWKLTGMLSMVLAFMNLLPIPALDGGHAVLLVYEMISGRKPSEKFIERSQQLGMLIILALMVFVFYNDLR